VLKESEVNVLLDGSAAEASEILTIAAEEPVVLKAIERVGADGITLCSLGCETHALSPFVKPERLNLPLVKRALKTGAVDAMVVGSGKRKESLDKVFPLRGKVHIPGLQFSWRSLVSVGLIGGIVPCPDALAILLVALAMGQALLGMAVVFSFSLGLSLILMSIGVFIVLSGRVLSQSSLLGRVSGIVPYFASIVIIGVGIWMTINMISKLMV
jgi:hypothetical protein